MKINTKTPLKTLKGEVINGATDQEFTIGDAISNILASSETGGKLKLFILAQKFATEDQVEVDSADLGLIKSAVEGSKAYTPLVSGQVLQILEDIK